MEHSFWFATLLNKLLGTGVAALLVKLHLPPADAAHPIPNYLAGEILVIIIIIVGALILRPRLSVSAPGKFQLMMEWVVEFCRSMVDDVIGPSGRQYVGLIGTLGILIVLCNLMGLIPGMESPTAHGGLTLGCAIVVFIHYNHQGIRHHGFAGYVKHLSGPLLAIAWLMLPLEIFSGLFRMLSLSVRLWANMMVGGLLEGIFTPLIPLVIPALLMALHIFESLLQAYIFMVLPVVYISLAVTEEH